MSRIRIDFAPRHRLPPAGLRLLIVVLLALLAGAVYQYARLDETARELSNAFAENSERLDELEAGRPAPPAAVPPERRQAVAAAISELNVRWPALLDALERSKPANAVLLRVEPRTMDRALLITAQTPDAGTLVDFMDALAAAPPFMRVTPLTQDPQAEGAGVALHGSFLVFWQDAKGTQP